jgi:cyanophycinase-like exopeptidase
MLLQTTGGDRAKLAADVKAADLYAVIAPQMGKQVRLGGEHAGAEHAFARQSLAASANQ